MAPSIVNNDWPVFSPGYEMEASERTDHRLGPSEATKDPSFLHADSEDSDHTGRMPRLI